MYEPLEEDDVVSRLAARGREHVDANSYSTGKNGAKTSGM